MPPANTATVNPSAASAARCAAPSMPYAPRTPPPRSAPPNPRPVPRQHARMRWPHKSPTMLPGRPPRRGARAPPHSASGGCASGRCFLPTPANAANASSGHSVSAAVTRRPPSRSPTPLDLLQQSRSHDALRSDATAAHRSHVVSPGRPLQRVPPTPPAPLRGRAVRRLATGPAKARMTGSVMRTLTLAETQGCDPPSTPGELRPAQPQVRRLGC